jgi:hypothetical protein
VQQEQQTTRGRILSFRRGLVPDRRPTRAQVQRTIRITIVVVGALLVILLLLYIIGLLFGKTVWELLRVLILPAALALGGIYFAERRAVIDREIADQRRQDDILQTYLDQIGQLLLDKDRPLRQSKKGDEVRTLAHARTLRALKRLDAERNRSLLRFLQDSRLVGESKDPIISFDTADLVRADLILLR